MRAGMAEMTEYERAQVYFEMNDYMEAARLLEPFAAEQPRNLDAEIFSRACRPRSASPMPSRWRDCSRRGSCPAKYWRDVSPQG